jgi:hypothetical protein
MDPDKAAPQGDYTHGIPRAMDVPNLGVAQGLPDNPDPTNLGRGRGPRASQANKPDPRISPAAQAALRRTRGY